MCWNPNQPEPGSFIPVSPLVKLMKEQASTHFDFSSQLRATWCTSRNILFYVQRAHCAPYDSGDSSMVPDQTDMKKQMRSGYSLQLNKDSKVTEWPSQQSDMHGNPKSPQDVSSGDGRHVTRPRHALHVCCFSHDDFPSTQRKSPALFETASSLYSTPRPQAELRLLRATVEQERAATSESELRRDWERLTVTTRRPHDSASWSVARALRGDGRTISTTRTYARRSVDQGLATGCVSSPLSLTHLPGYISRRILQLERYAKSVLARSPRAPARARRAPAEIVSHKWQKLVHAPAFWRAHCLALARPASPMNGRCSTKACSTARGTPAMRCAERPLPEQAHKFCTTLLLKVGHDVGKRLISGLYDKMIRFWDITTGEKKCLQVKKPVSCVTF
ncbi:hypothetical protein JB92DRAFT_2832234 [Gautieria morchelliformis]|nr:hypothetical protein JB92DRAFT_2832234 [Gautieria morchelliformis]